MGWNPKVFNSLSTPKREETETDRNRQHLAEIDESQRKGQARRDRIQAHRTELSRTTKTELESETETVTERDLIKG